MRRKEGNILVIELGWKRFSCGEGKGGGAWTVNCDFSVEVGAIFACALVVIIIVFTFYYLDESGGGELTLQELAETVCLIGRNEAEVGAVICVEYLDSILVIAVAWVRDYMAIEVHTSILAYAFTFIDARYGEDVDIWIHVSVEVPCDMLREWTLIGSVLDGKEGRHIEDCEGLAFQFFLLPCEGRRFWSEC